jgi:hypothetical protein
MGVPSGFIQLRRTRAAASSCAIFGNRFLIGSKDHLGRVLPKAKVAVHGPMVAGVQSYIGLGDVAPQPGSAPEGHKTCCPSSKTFLAWKGRIPSPSFLFGVAIISRKNYTGQFDASVDATNVASLRTREGWHLGEVADGAPG